jgi:O-antigen/teichoic acid export membrane protein
LAEVVVMAAFVSMFGTLSYESSVVVEENDKNAANIFTMCVLISLTICVIIFIVSLIAFGLENWVKSFYIAVSAQLLIFMNIIYSFFNRLSLYKKISFSQIIRSISIVVVQISFGYFFWTDDTLIIGVIFGSFVSILFLIRFLHVTDILCVVNRETMQSMATKHIDFVKYSTPQNIISYMVSNFPMLAIMFYYNAAILGLYYLAKKIVQIPGSVLGSAVKRVFYKDSAVLAQKKDFFKLYVMYNRMIKYLTLIIIIPVFVLFFYSTDIFVFVLGGQWRMSGEFAGWMALSFGSLFLASPARALFLVFNKQKNLLLVEISTGLIASILFIFSNYFYSLIDAVAYFSVSLLMSNIAVVVYWGFYLNDKKNIANN